MKKTILYLLLASFGLFSSYVLYVHGYIGLWQTGFTNLGTLQILLDLVIVCCLVASWMVTDAPKHGMSATPYIVITLLAGSFGPLLYLIRRESARHAADADGLATRA